ncbi:MAG: YdcF family protein [Thermoanaerobaculia bacterium]|nr:YdcF family protein [Thermoanaerobaculia bacterium]
MAPQVRERWRDFLGPGTVPSLAFAAATMVGGLGLPLLWWTYRVWRRSGESTPIPADVILVLGRALEGDRISRVFAERLARSAELWREGLAPLVFVAGGLTGQATRTEAAAGIEELERLGVPTEVLVGEGSSRYTLENLSHVRGMLAARGVGRQSRPRFLIVSDPLHTARISSYATGLGLDHHFAPAFAAAPSTRLRRWVRMFNEACFIHWYHAGVFYSRLVGNDEYLDRVS